MSADPGGPDAAIHAAVVRYYDGRLREFGATPRGVDWNGSESQALRFRQLLQVLDADDRGAVSLTDYGCGYGALVDHLREHGPVGRYCGFDLSETMIEAARRRHADTAWASFTTDPAALPEADYTVASGIFNVRLDHPSETWTRYVLETLDVLHASCRRGFAFNVLSTVSDPDRRRPDLFYADPAELLTHCQQRYSRRVALLHDTPLYELTLIVRK